jgi:hypothetical protein
MPARISLGERCLKQNEHNHIIATAATAHLSPIGCRRKGQSRFWFSDEQFWLIGVEFQPSSWSKGTYLNIGACWLWDIKDHFSFDTGPLRLGQFQKFESAEIFKITLDELASRASQEVLKLRKRFSNLSLIASHLESEAFGKVGWPLYHAAIASGLAGNIPASRLMFERLIAMPCTFDWEQRRLEAAKTLCLSLGKDQAFVRAVSDCIQQSRALRGLEPATNWLMTV